MPEEVLRYRVEIDEASLQSELARTRGAITNVIQGAISTSRYAINQVNADLAMTRQLFGTPGASLASPTSDLGFFGSALGAAGFGAPPNMLTSDFRRAASAEFQSRLGQAAMSVGREAIPVASGLGAVGLGMLAGAGPLGTLAMGAGGYLAGRVASGIGFDAMGSIQTASDILGAMKAPHPGMRFTQAQRENLAGGLARDIAEDVRFGLDELGGMLAMGHAAGAFSGSRSAEDFRVKFREMLDQVKTITRVFRQSTEEAMQTFGELNRAGVAGTGGMGGRMADILSLSRSTGLAPGQILQTGVAGAEMLGGMGGTPAGGFDAMLRNLGRVSTAESALLIDPGLSRRLGGTQGIAGQMTNFGFQVAGMSGMRNLLAGLTNEAGTELDQSRLRMFAQGQLSFEEVQQQAINKMADPAMQVRFASNLDLMRQQFATSGMAGSAFARIAEQRAQYIGGDASDVMNMMMNQMGMNPAQRQAMMPLIANSAQLDFIGSRRSDMARMEIEMDRRREESRFTSRAGAAYESMKVSFAQNLVAPVRGFGRSIGQGLEYVAGLPGQGLEALDLYMGEIFFGGAGLPEHLEKRRFSAQQIDKASDELQSAVKAITWRVDFGANKIGERLSEEEMINFEESAVAQFGGELEDILDEGDESQRKVMREKLRQKMKGWFHTNYGHLDEADSEAAKEFTDRMLSVESLALHNDNVSRGLRKVKENVSALQTRIYMGEEIPALLAMSAKSSALNEISGVASGVAADFKMGAEGGFRALKTLGEKAIPLLKEGSGIRERLEITRQAFRAGFLTPGDMQLSTKELGVIAEQHLSAEQARFVSALRKEADAAEGKQISAEQILRKVGQGLGGQYPSSTPDPGSEGNLLGQTAQVLDRLSGAVNNLSKSSQALLNKIDSKSKTTAGEA